MQAEQELRREALATAADRGTPVEIPEMRSIDTEVFANPDGTFTGYSYGAPKHVNRDGAWVDIDTRLRSAGSRLVTAATAADISLSTGGPGNAAVVTNGTARVTLGWSGNLPAPVVEGNTATYSNVNRDVDLVQTALNGGVEQSLILRKAPISAPIWNIPFGAKGLREKLLVGGRLSLTDSGGRQLFTSSAPVMRDAANAESPLLVTVVPGSDGFTLRVAPDLLWLRDPARVYPVTLDPVTDTTDETAHTYTSSGAPTTSYYTDPWLTLGKNSDGSTRRSFVRFNTGLYVNKHIISAHVRTHVALQSSSTSQVDMYDSGPISATTTYNNSPTIYANWDSASTVGSGSWQEFDAGAMMVRFASHNVNAGTVMLRANIETVASGYKRMDSGQSGSYAPELVVTYNTPPAVPTTIGITPHGGVATFTNSLTPRCKPPPPIRTLGRCSCSTRSTSMAAAPL